MYGDYDDEAFGPAGLLDDGAAGRGNIGQTADLRPGRSETLVQLTGEDWTAQQVTVVIAAPEPVSAGELVLDSSAVAGAHVVAELTWGVGGLRVTAEVDCMRGAMLSLPAASLVVVARHSLPLGPGPVYRVGAFVGYGARPGMPSPQRTLYVATTPEEAGEVAVPAFASSVRVMHVEGAVAFTLAFLGLARERLAEVVVDDGQAPPATPIPNGAVAVRIASARPSSFALVFGLAL